MAVYPDGNFKVNLLNVCLDRKKSFNALLKLTTNHQLRSHLNHALCENHLCYQNLKFALEGQGELVKKHIPNGGMATANPPKQDSHNQHILVSCLESEKKCLAIFRHTQKDPSSPIIQLIVSHQVKSIQRSILFLEKFLYDIKKAS